MKYRIQARKAFGSVNGIAAVALALAACGPIAPSITKNGYAGGNGVAPGPSSDSGAIGSDVRHEFSNISLRIVHGERGKAPDPAPASGRDEDPSTQAVSLGEKDDQLESLRKSGNVAIEIKDPAKPDLVLLSVDLPNDEIDKQKLHEEFRFEISSTDLRKFQFTVGKDTSGGDAAAQAVLKNLLGARFVFKKQR